MNAHAPLAGIGVLVTRPREQAERLFTRIRALGGEPWWLPALEIGPPTDPAALGHVLDSLAAYDLLVFVSPTAVAQGWPAIQAHGGLPAGARVAAVGQGTARELVRLGVQGVLAPADRADSEALLELPELASVQGWKVAIFRGEGGRTLLAEALAARGARVEHAVCYRRARARIDPAPVLAAWRAGRIHAVTVFSRESLDALIELLPPEARPWLFATPLFVPHPRIAGHARALGARRVIVTPPAEEGVLQALVEHLPHVHT